MKMLLSRSSYKIMKWTINFSEAVDDSGFITFTEAVTLGKIIAEARQKTSHYLEG